MVRHDNGWDFSRHGAVTYIDDEPFMTPDEYQSYRMAWIARYGHHDTCEKLTCKYKRFQPPGTQPKQIRDT